MKKTMYHLVFKYATVLILLSLGMAQVGSALADSKTSITSSNSTVASVEQKDMLTTETTGTTSPSMPTESSTSSQSSTSSSSITSTSEMSSSSSSSGTLSSSTEKPSTYSSSQATPPKTQPALSPQSSEPKMTVTALDVSHYKLTFSGLDAKYTDVQFPVWSDKNGQDDIRWYKAKRLTTGDWEATLSLSNHKFATGHYAVHVYAKNIKTGKQEGIQASQGFDVTKEQLKDFQPVLKTTLATDGVDILYQSPQVPNPQNLRIAVWSNENGQDDLRWYNGSSTGQVKALYSNHKGFGKYHVHVYSYENKKMIFQKASTYTLPQPKIQSSITKTDRDNYQITITNVAPYMQNILVPVWSEQNGQDDIRWYTATRQSNGSYQVHVTIANHKYTLGKYQVHIYGTVKMKGNPMVGLATTSGFNVTKLKATSAVASIQNINTVAGTFDVLVSDVFAPNGLRNILVPVWSEQNGQDDIRWYTATRQTNGTYRARVSLVNHRFDGGRYHAHVYFTEGNGNFIGVANTNAEIPKLNANISASYAGTGLFKFQFNRIPSTDDVKFAVWSEAGGQDDIRWYSASRKDPSTFTGSFNAQNHRGTGKYHIHLYATINGKLTGLATTTVQVNKASYSAPYYSQLDGRWSGVRLGIGSFGATGCVPTSLSMIISAIKGQSVTPIQVGNYLYYNTLEYNHSYPGTGSRGIVLATSHWGLKTGALKSQATLAKALQDGYYVIALVGGPSKYVRSGGHAIVLKGYSNGNTYVLDPYNSKNNGWTSLSYIWSVPSRDSIDAPNPFVTVTD